MKRVLIVAGLMLGTANVASAAPVYFPSGPQTGVSIATVLAGGWTQCYQASMGTAIGANAQSVLTPCTGQYLMMAGLETGANSFLVLAAALRADAIFNTGQSNVTHLANGSNWWFAPNFSWGFTAAGDAVQNQICDISDSPTSMCLHTLDTLGGFRINNITGLNLSTGHQKMFFQATDTTAAVPEPSTVVLLGLGLAGVAARLRRRR